MSHPSSVWHVPIVEPVHSSSTVSPSWPARETHVSHSSTAQSGGSIDSSTQSRLGSGVVRIGRGGGRSTGRSEKQTSTTGEENTSGTNADVKEAGISDSRESAQSESNEKNTNQRNQRRQRKAKQNNQNTSITNDDAANNNSSHQSYSNNNNSSRQDRNDGNESARMNGDNNNRGRGGAGRGRGRGGRGGRMARDNDPDGKPQEAFDLSSPPINSPSPSPRPDDAAHGEPSSSANRGRGGKRNRGRGNDNANKTNANPTNESISQTDSSTPVLNDSTVPPPQTQSQQSSKPKPSRKERQVAAKARRDVNEATNATPNNDDNATSVATASTSSAPTSSSPSVLNINAPSFVANSTLTPSSSSTSRAKANDGSVSTRHPPKADRPQSSQSGSQTSRPNTNMNDAKSNSTSIGWSDDPSNPVNIPSQPLVTELTQIARRYGSSYKQSQHRSTITCSFSFAPSDPDFPYALPPEKIVLQFVFADISLYPYTPLPQRSPTNESLIERLKRRIVVTCLNAEKDIPRFMRDVIERSITTFIHSTQLGQPQILRNTIKMVDKEILDWLILAQKKHNALIEKTIGKLTGVTAGGAQPTILATSASASSSSSSTSISSSASCTAAATSDASDAPPNTSSSSAASSSSQLVPPSSSPSSSPSLPSASPSVPIPNNPLEPGFDDIEPEDIWTTEQQAALEHGLKTISRTLPAGERWDLIAKCVEGKTKKQVLARYKEIREKVRLEQLAAQQPNTQSSSVGASSSKSKQSSVCSSPAISASESHASNSSLSSSFSLLSLSNAREIDPDESARLHAQRILQQQLEREEEARQAAEEEEERKRELKANGGKMKKQPKKEKKKADSEGDAGEGGDEVKEFVPVTERLSLNPQHRGTQLILSGVEMTLGILKSHTIRLQLLCVRCESRVDMEFTPSNGQHNPCTERCQRCGIIMVLVYRPEMVHEHSDSLGYVDLENGEVFDMLPSDFFGTCLGCFSEYPIKQLQRGVKGEGNCRSCHTRLEWKVEQFEFERITPAKIDYDNGAKEDTRGKKAAAAIDPREVAAAKNRSKEQALLKLGTPLPNKGSCKHYKHSYRWMRFPCCGKAFPCQECHDAVEDHPGVWATRMICGACSKEQPFSSKPCSSCGLAFSTVAKTFWEGGQGMRDRTRLSRNDSHKHVGLGKTTSMKASRVGPKAKETNKPKSKGNNTS